jgi:hypothetical protein
VAVLRAELVARASAERVSGMRKLAVRSARELAMREASASESAICDAAAPERALSARGDGRRPCRSCAPAVRDRPDAGDNVFVAVLVMPIATASFQVRFMLRLP